MQPAPQSSTPPFYRSCIVIDGLDLRDVTANFHIGMPVRPDMGRHTVLNYLRARVLVVALNGIADSSHARRMRKLCAA